MPTTRTRIRPVGDLIDHDDDDCICGPTVTLEQTDEGDRWVIVHHALNDGSL